MPSKPSEQANLLSLSTRAMNAVVQQKLKKTTGAEVIVLSQSAPIYWLWNKLEIPACHRCNVGGGGGCRWKCKPPKYRLELKSFVRQQSLRASWHKAKFGLLVCAWQGEVQEVSARELRLKSGTQQTVTPRQSKQAEADHTTHNTHNRHNTNKALTHTIHNIHNFHNVHTTQHLGGAPSFTAITDPPESGSDVAEQNQWNEVLELCFHYVVAPRSILAAGNRSCPQRACSRATC